MNKLVAIILISIIALGSACTWISESNETVNTGIKVHGNWELQVSPPDGEPVTYKFNNDLTDLGKHWLLRRIADEQLYDSSTQPVKFSTTEEPWWIRFGFTNTRWACDERSHVSDGNSLRHRVPATKTFQGQGWNSQMTLTATCTVKDLQGQFNTTHSIQYVNTEILVDNTPYDDSRIPFTEAQIASVVVQTDYVISATVIISLD